jgi:hypothetical protein
VKLFEVIHAAIDGVSRQHVVLTWDYITKIGLAVKSRINLIPSQMQHVIRKQAEASCTTSDVGEKTTKHIKRGLSGGIQRLKTRCAWANFRMASTKASSVAWSVYFGHDAHAASASILNDILNVFSTESDLVKGYSDKCRRNGHLYRSIEL